MAEDKIVKEIKKEELKVIKQVKKNPWMFATIALAVILVIVLAVSMSGGASKKTVSNNLLTFIESQTGEKATVVSINEENGMYNVTVNFKGQDVSVFVTDDGKFMAGQLIPLVEDKTAGTSSTNTDSGATEAPKSDKPKVELFIMSYCPYGTQMEKAILPVLSTLGDKIEFTLRFTHFTLHGEKEDTENFRQICIREQQGTKLNTYLQCILNSTSQSAPADPAACMGKVGINVANIDACMASKAADYYAVDSQLSQGYGVQGSPTLVINGVQVQSARSPAGVLSAICSAFNSAPAECSAQLPTAQASAGFGFSTSSADSAAASCG